MFILVTDNVWVLPPKTFRLESIGGRGYSLVYKIQILKQNPFTKKIANQYGHFFMKKNFIHDSKIKFRHILEFSSNASAFKLGAVGCGF